MFYALDNIYIVSQLSGKYVKNKNYCLILYFYSFFPLIYLL